ncbi:MAG: transcription elongation factor GreA [Deltaproteobacteria bacterium]|nr:transcription elongation factor GreA [Deltaproteobacteria bacterium]MBW2417509.1 transcription elongation factor GreA [Deltaproteobacteria bacterium]
MVDKVPMTATGYERLKQELHRLKTVERPLNVKEIETAIAHGDLSENAEYHAAKEKQSHIAGRIDQIDDRIARAQVIDPSGQEPDRVRFGATVVLEDSESGEEVSYRIVGEDESDVAQGLISVTSPVARALMNKEPDDEVTVKVPKGTRTFEILKIRYE